MRILILSLVCLLTACQGSKNAIKHDDVRHLPALVVTKIEHGKDGYMAYLEDDDRAKYEMLVSKINMEKEYVVLSLGDIVKVDGTYMESYPIQILPKKIYIIKKGDQFDE